MSTTDDLKNLKINTRIIIAGLWISHFLLWSFGDMLSLLQQMNDPVDNRLLLFIAVPLAIIQITMLLLSLVGPYKIVRLLNMIIPCIYIIFNIGFLTEALYGWEYLIGTAYLVLNVMMIRTTWKWIIN